MKKIEDKHIKPSSFSIYIDGKEADTALEWIEALFHNAREMGIEEQNLVSTISENLDPSVVDKLSECHRIITNTSYNNIEKNLELQKLGTRRIYTSLKALAPQYLGY